MGSLDSAPSPDPRQAAKYVEGLYDTLYAPLIRYARGACGRPEAAEDLVQEVFMRLHRSLSAGQTVENPRAWAFTVLRREIGRQFGEPHGGAFEPLDVLENAPIGRWRDDMQEFGSTDLPRLMELLSPREKEVLLLRLGEMKYREIAAELDISSKSVCTMLSRALKKLRRAVIHV